MTALILSIAATSRVNRVESVGAQQPTIPGGDQEESHQEDGSYTTMVQPNGQRAGYRYERLAYLGQESSRSTF